MSFESNLIIHRVNKSHKSMRMLQKKNFSVFQAVSQKLMAGFVECLESEEAEEGAEKVDGEGNIMLFSFCCGNLSLPMVSSFVFFLNDQN